MTDEYTFHQNVLELLPEIPPDSIVSRSIFEQEHLKGILFGFAKGQELSEHTASFPAVLHFIKGEAEVSLSTDKHLVKPGAWVHMAANVPHSILAKSELVMMLLLLR